MPDRAHAANAKARGSSVWDGCGEGASECEGEQDIEEGEVMEGVDPVGSDPFLFTTSHVGPTQVCLVRFDMLAWWRPRWWWRPVMFIRLPYEVSRILITGRGGVGWIPSWANRWK